MSKCHGMSHVTYVDVNTILSDTNGTKKWKRRKDRSESEQENKKKRLGREREKRKEKPKEKDQQEELSWLYQGTFASVLWIIKEVTCSVGQTINKTLSLSFFFLLSHSLHSHIIFVRMCSYMSCCLETGRGSHRTSCGDGGEMDIRNRMATRGVTECNRSKMVLFFCREKKNRKNLFILSFLVHIAIER